MTLKKSESKDTVNNINIFDYDADNMVEKAMSDIKEAFPYKETDTVTWINIDQVPPISFLNELRLGFDLHPVIIEDILNLDQRPKIEFFENYIFLTLKMVFPDGQGRHFKSEQVSMVISEKFLITFQQNVKGDTFEAVRNLIRHDNTRIRQCGTDYLAYELIRSVMSGYFKIIEDISESAAKLENDIVNGTGPKSLPAIYKLKNDLLVIHKFIWPMREVISSLERGESSFIKKATRIYFRDIYEEAIHIIESMEIYRDNLSGLLDVYLSASANRTNSIMKVLTIITTIFMPLSFIAGYYGMNFTYLKGLDSPLGPVIVTAVMVTIGLAMVLYFARRKWI